MRGSGGARRIRTDDILLAKQALYQLSYGPITGSASGELVDPSIQGLVGLGRLELPTLRLSGVRSNHLSYRPIRPPLKMDEPSLGARSHR